MSVSIDVAAIVQDEEELIPLMLRSCEVLLPNLRSVVIVDGGSKDGTIDIINSWRDRLPIDLVGHPFDNFCYQRNRALERCTADFIVGKVDADLTWTANMRDVIVSLVNDPATVYDVRCFFAVVDAHHYVLGHGSGYATIFWKNIGLRYVRPIHEYLVWPGEEYPKDRMAMVRGDWQSIRTGGRLKALNQVAVFDNSLRKSDGALRNRARRYARWAPLSKEAGISLPDNDDEWCIKNRDMLMHNKGWGPLPPPYAGLVIPGT